MYAYIKQVNLQDKDGLINSKGEIIVDKSMSVAKLEMIRLLCYSIDKFYWSMSFCITLTTLPTRIAVLNVK